MKPIKITLEITVHRDGSITLCNPHSGKKEMKLNKIPKKKDVKLIFKCNRYFRKVNKKPAKSCKGCTIQCRLRGIYKGESIEV